MNQRYNANISFNDLLANMLLGFVALFVLVLFLINPISKQGDVPTKAEIMIILDWDNDSTDDLDIWLMGPGMEHPLSFQQKSSGYMHLDRDDLGSVSDMVLVHGQEVTIKLNREVVNMRGIMPGDYFINVHIYSKGKTTLPVTFTVTVLDVNPYKEIYTFQRVATTSGAIYKLPAFTVDMDGNITHVFESDYHVVRSQKTSTTDDG